MSRCRHKPVHWRENLVRSKREHRHHKRRRRRGPRPHWYSVGIPPKVALWSECMPAPRIKKPPPRIEVNLITDPPDLYAEGQIKMADLLVGLPGEQPTRTMANHITHLVRSGALVLRPEDRQMVHLGPLSASLVGQQFRLTDLIADCTLQGPRYDGRFLLNQCRRLSDGKTVAVTGKALLGKPPDQLRATLVATHSRADPAKKDLRISFETLDGKPYEDWDGETVRLYGIKNRHA